MKTGCIRSILTAVCVVLLMALLTGCSKTGLTIVFDLPETVNSNYRLVCYASDKKKGAVVELFATVENGKFRLEAPCGKPMIVYIFSGASSPVAAFYAEGGDKIVISGDSPDPSSWKFSGNKLTEQWSDWAQANRDILSSHDTKRINDAVKKFVEKNRDNPLSTIFLLHYYSRRDDHDGFGKLWSSLGDNALNGKMLDLFPRTDVLDGTTSSASNMGVMVLSTLGNGADTIKPGKPTLLAFRSSFSDNKSDIITKLRKLALDYSDSTSRYIVDISFNPDIRVWRREAPRDSMRKIINACMPLGLSDSVAVALDVPRAPWFVVVGKNGKTVYAGDNIDEADRKFRNIAK